MDQVELGRHHRRGVFALQHARQFAHLPLQAHKAGVALELGQLQGVEEQIETAGSGIGVAALFGVGRGQRRQGVGEQVVILRAELAPGIGQAEVLHLLQVGAHQEVVGGTCRHVAAQQVGKAAAVLLQGRLAWVSSG